MAETAHWRTRPEGGGRFALWLIRTIVLRLGRPVGRLLLYPITAYYLLRRPAERAASRAWLARVLGRPPRWWHVARHIHTFAAVILDRPLLLTRSVDAYEVRTSGLEALHDSMDRGRGVLLLGSHLGSFEVLRVLSQKRPNARVAVLLERNQNPVLTRLLDELNPELACRIIDLGLPPAELMLRIKDEAERGALIGLLGDRRRPGEPGLPARFMGEQAWFPTAPWLIAKALQLPVHLCFGLYRGGRRYDLHFEAFAECVELPRGDRQAALAALVQRYAGRLEHHARDAPYNWFNFYDFWIADAPSPPARRLADRPVPAASGGGGAA